MRLLNFFKAPTPSFHGFTNDKKFDGLYPAHISILSGRHWTPLQVAYATAKFLAVENNAKILDIGSGVGKFCLAAAIDHPGCYYYVIEQRLRLLDYAEKAKHSLALQNVFFIHGNITQIDFGNFDHFYFFNSFYEHLEVADKIDLEIDFSQELYDHYSSYLYQQLAKLSPGTRLVTYHGRENQIPPDYILTESSFNNLLKCWIKK
ncbi:MAG: methyltransferase protein [Chitinophagaceae bacterium]|nr:methyltransferase protein [Chitinophagaceae bacterium]